MRVVACTDLDDSDEWVASWPLLPDPEAEGGERAAGGAGSRGGDDDANDGGGRRAAARLARDPWRWRRWRELGRG